MIKKKERKKKCIYILKSRFPPVQCSFSTYNKASVSLTLEDFSRYLQRRYMSQNQPLALPELTKKKSLNSKDVLFKTTSCAIQCRGESSRRNPLDTCGGLGRGQEK